MHPTEGTFVPANFNERGTQQQKALDEMVPDEKEIAKRWGGTRQGAGRPRKYRYLKMAYDSRSNEYVGVLPNGDKIVVDGDVYADGESVQIVKK